jgi:hypothetical protein
LTVPSATSGLNIHSEAMTIPPFERTAARTPSAAVTRKRPLEPDRKFGAVAPKGPDRTAASLSINHRLVRDQVAGHRGFTGPCEIGRRSENRVSCARDAPGCQGRVGEPPHTQRDVDPLLHQINVSVIEHHFHFEVRVTREELRYTRHQVYPREGQSRADAQLACQAAARTARCMFRLVRLFDRSSRSLIIVEASLCRCQPARSAH